MARSFPCTNPDLDETFVDFYKETCELISRLLHTGNETLILGGEGILGLEAACASLTEPGDPVLVLDNGVYGRGFADFVSMYGGKPVLYSVDEKNPIDPAALEEYLKEHHDYNMQRSCTAIPPSGMLNDISALCPLLKNTGYSRWWIPSPACSARMCAWMIFRLISSAAVPRKPFRRLRD